MDNIFLFLKPDNLTITNSFRIHFQELNHWCHISIVILFQKLQINFVSLVTYTTHTYEYQNKYERRQGRE